MYLQHAYTVRSACCHGLFPAAWLQHYTKQATFQLRMLLASAAENSEARVSCVFTCVHQQPRMEGRHACSDVRTAGDCAHKPSMALLAYWLRTHSATVAAQQAATQGEGEKKTPGARQPGALEQSHELRLPLPAAKALAR